MAKPYGINGTPWHVERVHNNNPDDGRRHRSRCVFYDPKAKYCSKQMGDCYGASHCKYYREGPRDLITTDTATFDTVQYVRPERSFFIAEKARDGTSENQIRVGDMVQKYGGKYMILDAELDENRHHVYSCVLARDYPNKMAAQGLINIYSNWYLTRQDPVKFHANDFGIVQHLPPAVVARVKSEREIQKARSKVVGQKQITVRLTSFKTDDYVFSTYTGKFSRPDGVRTEFMHLIVRVNGADKKLPVRVDHTHKVIYIDVDIYNKYLDKFRDQKRFELTV